MSEVDITAFEEDTLTELTRELLEDEETAYPYLSERWLIEVVSKLREARRTAGLTQKDVAERLGTKQPAIARLERDHEGGFSLRRFVEYALACGMLPLDITLESAKDLREHALTNLDHPITETSFEAWSDPSSENFTYHNYGLGSSWYGTQPSPRDCYVVTHYMQKNPLKGMRPQVEGISSDVVYCARPFSWEKPDDVSPKRSIAYQEQEAERQGLKVAS